MARGESACISIYFTQNRLYPVSSYYGSICQIKIGERKSASNIAEGEECFPRGQAGPTVCCRNHSIRTINLKRKKGLLSLEPVIRTEKPQAMVCDSFGGREEGGNF